MKNKLLSVLPAAFILYCLAFPMRTANAVIDGLTLWYNSILPTLLPFCIFSNIIVKSGVYDRFFERLHPVFHRVYPVRSPLIYPLVVGFLFGFPLGSMICSDLYYAGKISSGEAETVSCICNNFGPAFLYNYLFRTIFAGQLPAAAVFAACYMPPLLLGRISVCRLYRKGQKNIPCRAKDSGGIQYTIRKPAPKSHIDIKILDTGIMDGFTTMIRLAGYIILSALAADMILHIPFQKEFIKAVCIGFMEVTNGIRQAGQINCSFAVKAGLSIGIVNLGGISGLAQTYSMMRGTGFSIFRYLYFKLLCSAGGILIICIVMQDINIFR